MAIAQVDHHKKELFYSADELEEVYRSVYSGSSEKAQLSALRVSDRLWGVSFFLERFLFRLADYVNSEQTVAEHYFAPENKLGITLEHAANRIFACKIPTDRPLPFIEFRTVKFMAEHWHGFTRTTGISDRMVRFSKELGRVLLHIGNCHRI